MDNSNVQLIQNKVILNTQNSKKQEWRPITFKQFEELHFKNSEICPLCTHIILNKNTKKNDKIDGLYSI